MAKDTTIGVETSTRDLIRDVKPSWMEYDEFLMELLMHYDASDHHLDPRSMTYAEQVSYVIATQDVDRRILDPEFDLPEIEVEDSTPVSS